MGALRAAWQRDAERIVFGMSTMVDICRQPSQASMLYLPINSTISWHFLMAAIPSVIPSLRALLI